MPDYRKWVFSPRDRFEWHAWLKINNFEHYSLVTWSKLWDLATYSDSEIISPLSAQLSLRESVRIQGYSGPYFPAFGLKTERCGLFLRIQSKCGKIWTRIIPNTDTFHAVYHCIYFFISTIRPCKMSPALPLTKPKYYYDKYLRFKLVKLCFGNFIQEK